ncbi:fumarylacetoacetate hydrolase FahA [Myriangium duriaei CBS 260.36]|uniref:Fumarylacetoacetase n=1 Tax=Myriangium duriaei CBS 260.36 TaxID=1168546 RepID=A0A9P4JAD1_9PEZI|nr:fumarylacetoacetate hydrolase FahA [Myriangium duriaei CBS 260.36]
MASPLKSWLSIPPRSPFSIANIPFGIITHAKSPDPHTAVAIGEYALDLDIFTAQNGFSGLSIIQPHQTVFSSPTLNDFAALGKPMHSAVRKYIQSVFLESTPFPKVLKDNKKLQEEALIPLKDVKNHVPMQIGDYTDFYAGLNHAYNVGVMFRGPANALQPNYKHLPVGYHGRASSVVVSGTPIRRPNGQILENPAAEKKVPVFSKCKKLDIELELGAFLCKGNEMGHNVPLSEAEDYIFGLVLLNDWSARDIQAWEYVPLGPFNAKNFASTISPWVVLTEALEPFKTSGMANDVETLPYLQEGQAKNFYDINLQVDLTTGSGKSSTIGKVSATNLLFSFHQMLAHHSIGGCPMNVGDLLGSGTISGKEVNERGALLEQTDNGKNPISVDGEKRSFLEDGDSVTLRGYCGDQDGGLVGFGDCEGTILEAVQLKF